MFCLSDTLSQITSLLACLVSDRTLLSERLSRRLKLKWPSTGTVGLMLTSADIPSGFAGKRVLNVPGRVLPQSDSCFLELWIRHPYTRVCKLTSFEVTEFAFLVSVYHRHLLIPPHVSPDKTNHLWFTLKYSLCWNSVGSISCRFAVNFL